MKSRRRRASTERGFDGMNVPPTPPIRILIADDSRAIRESVSAVLGSIDDVYVTTVENGAKALKEACTGVYALLVCDIEMPVMSGTQLLRVLRQQFFSGMELPVIMLTQAGDTDHKTRAFADGANDYVTKPVEPQELIARARAQIQLRHLYREHLANQALALHAQKLAAVSQLSATLAHELNTPAQYLSDNLTFLNQSFVELVRMLGEGTSWPEPLCYLQSEIPNSLKDMREGVFRISSLVQTISEFAEGDQHRITSVDLPRAIGRVVELLRSRWLGLVELSAHHSPNVHNVHCGPVDLKHALWQLIAQAIDEASMRGLGASAIADKGRVDIATRRDADGVLISVRATRPLHKRAETMPPSDPDVLRVTRAVLHRQRAELTRQIEADGSSTTLIRLPA